MPAKPVKPWFREDRNAYFVTLHGKQHNLGSDKTEAERRFHELLAQKPQATPRKASGLTVAEVFEKFLEWCQKHKAKRTYEFYRDHIQAFIDFKPEIAQLLVPEMKPFHVIEWVDSHDGDWGDTYRRGAIIAIQRPFNWADELGYIDASPIKRIKKPQAKRREQVVTPEEWLQIRDHYPENDPFRDLLEFSWECGTRPQEARNIEAHHVNLDRHCVVFPPAEAKGKKRWRIIHLTDRAEAILRRLLELRPTGFLFLNAKGRPWTPYATNCRFERLKKHLGTKYAMYSVRHGFGTRKLEEGHDHLTVAAWMGHADGSMLARVYSHVGERHDYLHEKLNAKVPES